MSFHFHPPGVVSAFRLHPRVCPFARTNARAEDPTKSVLRIYDVPFDSFQSDDEEGEGDEEEEPVALHRRLVCARLSPIVGSVSLGACSGG